MKFRHWLGVGTLAFIGHVAFNCGTETVQLYNDEMPQGLVKIEKVDRRPFRRDDRLTEIIQEGRTILFKNYAPGASPFLEDEKDYIKVRMHDGNNLLKREYRGKSFTDENFTTYFYSEYPEASPQHIEGLAERDELSQLFSDVSNQYAVIKIEQNRQESEDEYRRKLEKKLSSKNN